MRLSTLFLLLLSSCLGADPTVTVKGARTVYRGYNVYVQFSYSFSGTPSHVYFNSISVPSGWSYQLYCSNIAATCNTDGLGRPFEWLGTEHTTLRITPPAGETVGTAPVVVTIESGGVTQDINLTFSVIAVPTLTTQTLPSPFPAIPGLSKWQSTMTTLGDKWCNPTQSFNFGVETEVWYYDGARVFFQLADYTKQSSYTACAMNVAQQYAAYVISATTPGWRVFPHGLETAYSGTGTLAYKTAIDHLANYSAFSYSGGYADDVTIRETAYMVNAYLAAYRNGVTYDNTKLERAIDYLIGYFHSYFIDGDYTENQSFTDGLAAEALISYYDGKFKDPRIPPTIKLMLDWMWTVAWNPSTNSLLYCPDPAGPHCTSTLCQQYVTDLINLVAPAFAWYWRLTGDSDYLDRGDTFFYHALDSDISYSGKIFSQNYRWSFAYVAWRTSNIGTSITGTASILGSGAIQK